MALENITTITDHDYLLVGTEEGKKKIEFSVLKTATTNHVTATISPKIEACYSVCQGKSATIPAEKTLDNLPGTIESIPVGYTSGDIAVPVTGNITGAGSNHIAVQGSVRGGVCGSVGFGYGTAVGSGVLGDIYSDSCGAAVVGSVNGNICGTVCGYIYNYVCGYIGCGYGTAIYGGVCGDICGYICGNICGFVSGDVYSGVCGNVCGSICGWFKPENVTTSTVLTLDQNSDNNALLKIDVCGKQYYIHAN